MSKPKKKAPRSAKAKDLRGAAAVYRQAQRKTAKKVKRGQHTRQDAEKYKKLADHYKAQAARNPKKATRKATAKKATRKATAKKATRKATAKKNSRPKATRKEKNAPSLIGSIFPVDRMAALGAGAAADLDRLTRGTVIQRRSAAGGKGKGTRQNPIKHRISLRGTR